MSTTPYSRLLVSLNGGAAAAGAEAAAGTDAAASANLPTYSIFAPSRNDFGTAEMASSHKDETKGSTMIPTTMAPEAALKTWTLGNMFLRNGVT